MTSGHLGTERTLEGAPMGNIHVCRCEGERSDRSSDSGGPNATEFSAPILAIITFTVDGDAD